MRAACLCPQGCLLERVGRRRQPAGGEARLVQLSVQRGSLLLQVAVCHQGDVRVAAGRHRRPRGGLRLLLLLRLLAAEDPHGAGSAAPARRLLPPPAACRPWVAACRRRAGVSASCLLPLSGRRTACAARRSIVSTLIASVSPPSAQLPALSPREDRSKGKRPEEGWPAGFPHSPCCRLREEQCCRPATFSSSMPCVKQSIIHDTWEPKTITADVGAAAKRKKRAGTEQGKLLTAGRCRRRRRRPPQSCT